MVNQSLELIRTLLFSKSQDASTPEGRSQLRYKRAALTSLVMISSRVTNILTGLLTIPMTLKYLGADLFGIWMVVTSFVGFLSFYDFGIGIGLRNTLIECLGKDDRESPRKLIGNALLVLILLAFVMVLVVIFVLPLLPWGTLIKCKDPTSVPHILPAMQAVLLMFALGLPVSQLQNIANAYQRGYWGYLCFLVGRLLGFFFVVWCVKEAQPLWLLAGGYVGIPFFVTCGGWLIFFKVAAHLRPWPVPFEKETVRRLFGIGFFVLIHHLSYAMINTSAILLIANTIDAASATPYSVTQKLLGVSSVVTASILLGVSVAIGEAWHRTEYGWVIKAIKKSEHLVFLFGILPLFAFLLVGQRVILWWTKSPQSVPSPVLLLVCVLLSGVQILGNIYSNSLMAMNFVHFIAYTEFFAGIIVLLGGYFVGLITKVPTYIAFLQLTIGAIIPSFLFWWKIKNLLSSSRLCFYHKPSTDPTKTRLEPD